MATDKQRMQKLAGILKEEENKEAKETQEEFSNYEFDNDFEPKEENSHLYDELKDKK